MSVVVAFSATGQGRSALHAASRKARRRGLPLVVGAHGHGDAPTPPTDEQIRAGLEHDVRAEVPSPLVDLVVERDDLPVAVDEMLLSLARRHSAHLLVIALRGTSRAGKLTLGAGARHLVVASPCPVLAVKDTSVPTA